MRALLAICLVAAAIGCRDDAAAEIRRAESLDTYGQLPSFELTDQRENAVSDKDLAGQVLVVNFIFTRCPTVCPVFTRKMVRLRDRLDGVDPLLFVSVSVDPEHDTPAVLRTFAGEHGADDPARWKFLTGDREKIQQTMEQGLKLALEDKGVLEDGTPDIVHATHFVLIDASGAVRGYYDSSVKERLDALVEDAKALARLAKSKRSKS